MNCRKRGTPSGDAQVRKNPSETYGEMKKTDGQTPRSFDPVVRHPYWEDAPAVLKPE